MSEYTSFDQLENDYDGSSTKNEKAIWEVGWNKEEELHKWLLTEYDFLVDKSKDRLNEIKKHTALYKGIHYYSQESRTSRRDREETSSKFKTKVVVNHLYDITEQKVARAVKFRPNVSVLPVQDEQEDRYSAKMAKMVYDHVYDQQRLDYHNQEAVRSAHIGGEAYLFCEWNPDAGDELEESKRAREEDQVLPLLDENGEEIKDALGNKREINTKDNPVNKGEIELWVESGYNIFLDMKEDYRDCEFMFRREVCGTAELKKRYPNKAGKLNPDKSAKYFDFSRFEEQSLRRQTWVIHCYVRNARYAPGGRYIKFTRGCILENRELGYSHGDFPCERLYEIKVPGQLHGQSAYVHGRSLQAHYNNMSSMELRNLYMLGHPKIAVPYKSCNLESLGNDATILQYKGPVKPEVLSFNPTPPQVADQKQHLVEVMGQIMGVHGVSRGEPPPGVKAGVALQFLAEQEHERQNAFIANYNEFVRRSAQKIISTAGDYYQAEDDRVLRVIGKDNEYLTEYLDPKYLTKAFDYKIQNSSALPRSMPARTQQILDLQETFPDMFSREQVMDMLELGNTQRMYDESTAVIKMAEQAFENLCDGKESAPPEKWQDHINWWKVFSARIQSIRFSKLDQERKNMILDHIEAREMLMMEKAEKNPAFMQEVEALAQWPLMYEKPLPPPPPPMPPGEEMMPPPGDMGMPPEAMPPEAMGAPGMGPPPPPMMPNLPNLEQQGMEENPELPPINPLMPS